MTVKEICTEYSKLGNETLKKQCLDKIKITPYVVSVCIEKCISIMND